LLKVRQLQRDQTRIRLAACSEAEAVATQRIDALDLAEQRNNQAEAALSGQSDFLAIAALWHVQARSTRRSLVVALTDSAGKTAEARSDLAAAVTAAEAVRHLAEQQAEARDQAAARREQNALDDVARNIAFAQKRSRIVS
jgi:hypothetical protein